MKNTDQSSRLSNDAAKYKRLRDIGILVLAIVCGFVSVNWMLSDITGEYTVNDPGLGIVNMSLTRKASNIYGELSYGRGAILEATIPEPNPDRKLDLTFELPQRWLKEGRTYRKVLFHGKVHDGTISGVLQENGQVYPIKLERNTLSSICRQIQSHFPGLG